MTITFQCEKFAALYAEAKPMLERHFKEIALYQDRIPLSPDTERYLAGEKQGSLIIVTAREDGNLVGYASVVIGKRMHNVTIVSALIESLWLAPECRGKGAGSGMFDAVEEVARSRGALTVHCHSKIQHPALSFLLGKRGYEQVEIVHSKFLSEGVS